eukprot:13155062-Ditylum_brightwellii.AAC.1
MYTINNITYITASLSALSRPLPLVAAVTIVVATAAAKKQALDLVNGFADALLDNGIQLLM